MTSAFAEDTSTYDSSQIQVLQGLDPVRKRPGMYIGSTGQRGLHHLIYEILDNSIDEIQGGFATCVYVDMDLGTNVVTIRDNGRGIPTDVHPTTGKSALETVLTVLHAGGKFGGGQQWVSGVWWSAWGGCVGGECAVRVDEGGGVAGWEALLAAVCAGGGHERFGGGG